MPMIVGLRMGKSIASWLAISESQDSISMKAEAISRDGTTE
jgi:hypothetical protein